MNAIGLLALSLFAAPQTSNPYCGTSPDSFYPIPAFSCPGNGPWIVDIFCVEACAELWQTEMQLAYDEACAAYDAGYTEWQAWDSVIQTAYEACMSVAQTPQDGVNCYRAMLENQRLNNESWEFRQQAIENELAADVQDAMDTFQNCAAECCYAIEDPDEN